MVAWHLLVLRHVSRADKDAPPERVVNSVQLHILQKLQPKILGDKPTAYHVMLAVARLGGHLRQNGDPGWLVLGREWDELLTLETGYRLAN